MYFMVLFYALCGTVVRTSHLRCALHFCYCIYFVRFMVLLPIMLCNTVLICFCLPKSPFLSTFVCSLITCFFFYRAPLADMLEIFSSIYLKGLIDTIYCNDCY